MSSVAYSHEYRMYLTRILKSFTWLLFTPDLFKESQNGQESLFTVTRCVLFSYYFSQDSSESYTPQSTRKKSCGTDVDNCTSRARSKEREPSDFLPIAKL